MSTPIEIYIDADACPVKDEVYRVGERYALPPLDLLDKVPSNAAVQKVNDDSLQKNARLLESVLEDFGVKGEIVQVRPGPVVTLYELEPAPGTKTSRVVGLADDVARSMSAVSVRIAVVPGRSVIGIELPNRVRETVYLRELLESEAFERTAAKLALVFGKDISGAPIIVDLQRMPHLLIAGTTGSGKSVAINTMILSLVYRLTPDQCRLIMVDPKMLELSVYDGIPHLLTPVVTDPKKAVVALKWAVREMEQRYAKMAKIGARGVEAFNDRVKKAKEKGEVLKRTVQTGFDRETGKLKLRVPGAKPGLRLRLGSPARSRPHRWPQCANYSVFQNGCRLRTSWGLCPGGSPISSLARAPVCRGSGAIPLPGRSRISRVPSSRCPCFGVYSPATRKSPGT
jgi:DNA segregation ATPase FtsK/SpoIIIE-like protein